MDIGHQPGLDYCWKKRCFWHSGGLNRQKLGLNQQVLKVSTSYYYLLPIFKAEVDCHAKYVENCNIAKLPI